MNMTVEQLTKYLSDNKLNDGLLKDFVARGLWKPAIMAIDEAVTRREREIAALGVLKGKIVAGVAK